MPSGHALGPLDDTRHHEDPAHLHLVGPADFRHSRESDIPVLLDHRGQVPLQRLGIVADDGFVLAQLADRILQREVELTAVFRRVFEQSP
jgi:hypothetical protein